MSDVDEAWRKLRSNTKKIKQTEARLEALRDERRMLFAVLDAAGVRGVTIASVAQISPMRVSQELNKNGARARRKTAPKR